MRVRRLFSSVSGVMEIRHGLVFYFQGANLKINKNRNKFEGILYEWISTKTIRLLVLVFYESNSQLDATRLVDYILTHRKLELVV